MTFISLSDYFGNKPDLYPEDYTDEIKENAALLLERVNDLLSRLEGVYFDYEGINSGWRPRTYNNTIPNAAKNSKHITAQAIDLTDHDGRLKDILFNHSGDLLLRYRLWMEHPASTKGWCHLQSIPPKSGARIFSP